MQSAELEAAKICSRSTWGAVMSSEDTGTLGTVMAPSKLFLLPCIVASKHSRRQRTPVSSSTKQTARDHPPVACRTLGDATVRLRTSVSALSTASDSTERSMCCQKAPSSGRLEEPLVYHRTSRLAPLPVHGLLPRR